MDGAEARASLTQAPRVKPFLEPPTSTKRLVLSSFHLGGFRGTFIPNLVCLQVEALRLIHKSQSINTASNNMHIVFSRTTPVRVGLRLVLQARTPSCSPFRRMEALRTGS